MPSRRIITLIAALTLAAPFAAAQNRLTPRETQEGWKLLFDGSTLNGWEQRTTSQPERRAGPPAEGWKSEERGDPSSEFAIG